MSSPPMWSIGKSRRQKLQTSCSPGPNIYSPNKSQTHNPATWKIGTEKRKQNFLGNSNAPGPGEYSPHLTSINKLKSPQYPFGIRLNKVMASSQQTPGVGHYHPIKTTEIWSKFSFSYKPEPDVVPKTVGPADYKPSIKPTIRHVPSCQFGTSTRDSKPPSLNPSPDHYQPNSGLLRSPQFTFTKTVRSGSVNFNTPGPGSYEHKSSLSQKMITMISRRNNSLKGRNEKTPAPNTYYPEKYQQFCGVPSSIIGNDERNAFAKYEDNPGPGEYETTDVNKPEIRQSRFPKSKRVPLQKAGVDTPGPGNYENKSYTKEGPTHIIAKKLYLDFSEKFPGPAHYEPQYKKLQRRVQEQQIGTSQRPDLHLNTETPGPGNYHLLKNPEGLKYSIGNELRDGQMGNDYPGPGEYDIPVQIANVPLYALPKNSFKNTLI